MTISSLDGAGLREPSILSRSRNSDRAARSMPSSPPSLTSAASQRPSRASTYSFWDMWPTDSGRFSQQQMTVLADRFMASASGWWMAWGDGSRSRSALNVSGSV